MTDIQNVTQLVRRAIPCVGIQFTGKNGKDVVKFIKEYFDPNASVRNGGTYVKVVTENGAIVKVLRTNWVVVDPNDSLIAPLSEADFKLLYNLKK